jgi:hypothetical protein
MFTFTHLSTGGQLDRQRQRDLLARADQQRLVRQLRERARTSRPTERAGRRITRVLKRTRPATLPV